MQWQTIETAPRETTKIYVVKAVGVQFGTNKNYTSDPYCVWHDGKDWVRWPHHFDPTHWVSLPD